MNRSETSPNDPASPNSSIRAVVPFRLARAPMKRPITSIFVDTSSEEEEIEPDSVGLQVDTLGELDSGVEILDDVYQNDELSNNATQGPRESFNDPSVLQSVAVPNAPVPQISDRMIRFISLQKYKMILFGTVQYEAAHPILQQKGQLTDEEKPLFDYVNTVLQYPPNVTAADFKFRPATIRNYTSAISQYLGFLAKNDYTVETFKIDGELLIDCLEDWAHKRHVDRESETSDGSASITKYSAALMALQQFIAVYQLRESIHASDYPRMLKTLSKVPNIDMVSDYEKHKRSLPREPPQEKLHNKGNIIQNLYTDELIKKMMRTRIVQTGSGIKTDIYDGINGQLEFLLGHHYMFRSQSKRSLEISDCLWDTLETNKGTMQVLGFSMLENQTLTPEMCPFKTGAVRNKDVELCFVSAFAMSLWYRFDFDNQYAPLAGDKLPNFSSKEDWYPLKVLFTAQAKVPGKSEISYNYILKLNTQTIDNVGFALTKKTHLGLLANAQRADAAAIEDSQIRRAGRWSQDVMHKHYVRDYPIDFIHFSAGFESHEKYYIDRDIEVPEALQRQIFPWLERVTSLVANRINPPDTPRQEMDNSVDLLMKMLKDFRKIIIQDLAVLLDSCSDSMYCQHTITSDPMFIDFRAELKKILDRKKFDGSMKLANSIQDASPYFTAKMEAVREAIERQGSNAAKSAHKSLMGIEELKSQIQQGIPTVAFCDELLRSLRVSITDSIFSSFAQQHEAIKNQVMRMELTVQHLVDRVEKAVNNVETAVSKIERGSPDPCTALVTKKRTALEAFPAEIDSQFAARSAEPAAFEGGGEIGLLNAPDTGDGDSDSPDLDLRPQEGSWRVPQKTAPSPYIVVKYKFPASHPVYQLNKTHTTIPQVAREWFVSRSGLPCVTFRDSMMKNEWRSHQPTKSTYKRCKKLMKFIEEATLGVPEFSHLSPMLFAELIEIYRVRTRLSLDKTYHKCDNGLFREQFKAELLALQNELDFAPEIQRNVT